MGWLQPVTLFGVTWNRVDAMIPMLMVANQLGGAFSIPVIGIMVALLLQALNIVLAIFSPSIHAMRLHIVVFFSKFYDGGGGKYRPFRKTVVEEAGD